MNTHSPIPPAPQFCAERELKFSLTSNRVLLFAAHLLVMGCNGTQFGRAGGDGSHNAPADQRPIGAVASDQSASSGGPPAVLGPLPNPPPLPQCPAKPQKVLILDFKSGWWSMDGGEFFAQAMSALIGPCQSTVTVEYHHIFPGDNSVAIVTGGQAPILSSSPNGLDKYYVEADLNAYQQIWILSGSNEDYGDMPVTEPSFVSFSSRFSTYRGAIMLGIGAGFISHSQALASKIGLDGLFEARAPANLNISFDPAMTISTRLVPGKNLSGHILFQGIVTGIADDIRLSGLGGGLANAAEGLAKSDSLRLPANWQAAARADDGKTSIGVGRIGDRNVVLESGIQRFYGIGSHDKDTQRYLSNLLAYLAL